MADNDQINTILSDDYEKTAQYLQDQGYSYVSTNEDGGQLWRNEAGNESEIVMAPGTNNPVEEGKVLENYIIFGEISIDKNFDIPTDISFMEETIIR